MEVTLFEIKKCTQNFQFLYMFMTELYKVENGSFNVPLEIELFCMSPRTQSMSNFVIFRLFRSYIN